MTLLFAALLQADAGSAVADVVTAPSAWDWIVSPTTIGLVLSVVAAILGAVKWLNVSRKKAVAEATFHAFNIVEDMAAALKKTAAGVPLEKVAEGLKAADAWMLANGWRTLSEQEKALVKLGFQSIHGAEKVIPAAPAANP